MNTLIITNFEKLIKLTEIDIFNNIDILINRYRLISLKKIIKIISNLKFEISSIDKILNIPGIGKNTINRIDEILKTGKLKELKNYDKIIKYNQEKEKIINELMKIIGIGNKIACDLINKYNIKSIDHFKKLISTNKIYINDKIKLGLKYLGKFEGAIPRNETHEINILLNNITLDFNNDIFLTICGSYRRGNILSSDIDILVCNFNYITEDQFDNNDILENYIKYLHDKKFIVDDITDKNYKTKYMGFCRLNNNSKIRRIDIRYVPLISYIPALMYFTGSYQFNKDIRVKAKKLGYKLNEYGLFEIKTNNLILTLSEQDIFDKLDMKYISPGDR